MKYRDANDPDVAPVKIRIEVPVDGGTDVLETTHDDVVEGLQKLLGCEFVARRSDPREGAGA